MPFSSDEIIETFKMIKEEHLDVRTVTMGISLMDCADPDSRKMCKKIEEKITKHAKNLNKKAAELEERYGIPIINKRIAVTPIAFLLESSPKKSTALAIAKTLDKTAKKLGIDFIGGFSALADKGFTKGSAALIDSIPEALSKTERLCASANVASSQSGINMDAVLKMAKAIKKTSELTKRKNAVGCAKLVVFANAVPDNPFMAGAFHGPGLHEVTINVGISGPGVVKTAVQLAKEKNFRDLAAEIKRTAFKITRVGELMGRALAEELNCEFGIVDLSLAPTTNQGDSVAEILEEMGLEKAGTHGTTAALLILTDAMKKGGLMATSSVGGLSGAFIPVSEDTEMNECAKTGALSLDKLEALTSICSVGLDMVCLPGSTSAETIAGIIADEMAIGVINNKTTGCRLIPVPGKKAGGEVNFGGLLGKGTIMKTNKFSSDKFTKRKGQIPRTAGSVRN